METTQLKKEIYKQAPLARLNFIRKGNAYYETVLNLEPHNEPDTVYVQFIIPVSDMGEADFLSTMEAKLLLRWIK